MVLVIPWHTFADVACHGKMLNPIKDICWKCLFPIYIAGAKIASSKMPDKAPGSRALLCKCTKPPISIPKIGIPIGFWEPVRVIDVTRSPFCMVSLGGISLGSSMGRGYTDFKESKAFYHVHWYIYPAIYILELLTDFVCMEKMSLDIAYLTEMDPLWQDDTRSAVINPEAILFANPLAQGACITDCAKSSFGLPIDSLRWCAGCQGSMYPFTGTISGTYGGVHSSSLLAARIIAKLHRQLLLWGTWGKKMTQDTCCKWLAPFIEKSAYRLQMVYPIAETKECKRIGQSTLTWQGGKEYPVKGEDFSYFVWRKRECCLTAY
jgi:conjugal transfer pilus assembly protein TraU